MAVSKVQRIAQLLSTAALRDGTDGRWSKCLDDFNAFIRDNVTREARAPACLAAQGCCFDAGGGTCGVQGLLAFRTAPHLAHWCLLCRRAGD